MSREEAVEGLEQFKKRMNLELQLPFDRPNFEMGRQFFETQSDEEMTRFVNDYREETGFPLHTAEIIRSHLHESIASAVADSGIDLVFSGCDSLGSVGKLNDTALPGSDVDGFMLLFASSVQVDQRLNFADRLQRLLNRRLVDLIVTPYCFATGDGLLQALGLDYLQRSIKLNSFLNSVVVGTSLWEKDELILRKIRESQLAKEIRHINRDNRRPYALGETDKYRGRKKLREIFETLPLGQQFVVVRSHRRWVENAPYSKIEMVRYRQIMTELLELGLFKISSDDPSGLRPTWL